MTYKETIGRPLKPGYWWHNVSALGDAPDWQERVMPPVCDPNDTRLFGYEEKEFLAKQYK